MLNPAAQARPVALARLAALDALRAVAALLVLVTHGSEDFFSIAQAAQQNTWLYRLSHLLDFGRIGVVVFFLVSGHVVASTLALPASTLHSFLVRRFFRLYPLYWVSVVATCALLLPEPVTIFALLANLSMLPSLFGVAAFSGLYWTLETELVFYLLAVLLHALRVDDRPLPLLALVAALIVVFALGMFGWLPAPESLAWKSLPLHLSFMLVGMLTQVWTTGDARDGTSVRVGLSAHALGLAVVLCLAPSFYSLFAYFGSHSPDHLRWGLSYPVAMGVFLSLRGIRPGRTVRWLGALGVISYSLYLLHPFALRLLHDQLARSPAWMAQLGLSGCVVLAVVVTAGLSWLSYRLVEMPGMALAKRTGFTSPI